MSSTVLTSELQALRKENQDLKEQNANLLSELESLKKENLDLRNSQPLSIQKVAETPLLVNQTEFAREASTSDLSKEKDDEHISKKKVNAKQSKFLPMQNQQMNDEGKQRDEEKSTIGKSQLGKSKGANGIAKSTNAKSESVETKAELGSKIVEVKGSAGFSRSQLADRIGAKLEAKSVSPKGKSEKVETVVKPGAKQGEGLDKRVNSESSKSRVKKLKTKAASNVANSAKSIAEGEEEKAKPIGKLKSKPKKRKPKKLNKGLLMFEASGGKLESPKPKVKFHSAKKRKKKKKGKTGKLALKFANMPVMGMASPKGRPRSNTSPSRRSSNFEDDEKKENVDTNQMIKARPVIKRKRRVRTRQRPER